MTLSELKEKVDFYSEHYKKDLDVVVVLQEPSMGARSCSKVVDIFPGIDWESGRLSITTEQALVKKLNPTYIDLSEKESGLIKDIKKIIDKHHPTNNSRLVLDIISVVKKYNKIYETSKK